MKSKILLAVSLCAVICFISLLDRKLLKANHGFCLHVIEAQVPSFPNPSLSFPKELFNQPYHYLGKGAQSFVFESQDKKTVLKFYRFPSHLRRFPWTHHPFGYLFSTSRKNIKEHNLKRLELSFHSFFLAADPLMNETGVLYVHVKPTTNLGKKVHLIDRLGFHYEIPLDTVAFIVQKRGESFLPRFKKELKSGNQDMCKQMLNSLIHVIRERSKHHITDLDNMDNDNYGWLENKAIHLDIGRFQEKKSINVKDEILRVSHPLIRYLSETSPEMLNYFESRVEKEFAVFENSR